MIKTSEEAREKSADLRSKSCDVVISHDGGEVGDWSNLVLPSFPTVRAFHVHNHDTHSFSSAHPYTYVEAQLRNVFLTPV